MALGFEVPGRFGLLGPVVQLHSFGKVWSVFEKIIRYVAVVKQIGVINVIWVRHPNLDIGGGGHGGKLRGV